MGCFSPKYLMFELRKYQGFLCLMTLKIDAKFEGKLTCSSKKDMENLANFHRLKNSDFILESKIVELNRNNQIDQMQCENFILHWK